MNLFLMAIALAGAILCNAVAAAQPTEEEVLGQMDVALVDGSCAAVMQKEYRTTAWGSP